MSTAVDTQAPPGTAGVQVSFEQIYAQLQEANKKLDVLTSEVRELRKDSDDYEARLRALEKARWPLPSLAALVAFASLVVAIVAVVQK